MKAGVSWSLFPLLFMAVTAAARQPINEADIPLFDYNGEIFPEPYYLDTLQNLTQHFRPEIWLNSNQMANPHSVDLAEGAMKLVSQHFLNRTIYKFFKKRYRMQCAETFNSTLRENFKAVLRKQHLCMDSRRAEIPQTREFAYERGRTATNLAATSIFCSLGPKIASCIAPTIVKLAGCTGNETAASIAFRNFINRINFHYCFDGGRIFHDYIKENQVCLKEGIMGFLHDVISAQYWLRPAEPLAYICVTPTFFEGALRHFARYDCDVDLTSSVGFVAELRYFIQNFRRAAGCRDHLLRVSEGY